MLWYYIFSNIYHIVSNIIIDSNLLFKMSLQDTLDTYHDVSSRPFRYMYQDALDTIKTSLQDTLDTYQDVFSRRLGTR